MVIRTTRDRATKYLYQALIRHLRKKNKLDGVVFLLAQTTEKPTRTPHPCPAASARHHGNRRHHLPELRGSGYGVSVWEVVFRFGSDVFRFWGLRSTLRV